MTDSQRPEMVVARLRSHGRALFWPTAALIVVVGATTYFSGKTYPQSWMTPAIVGAGLVLVIVMWLLPLLAWLGRNYTVTTRRIVLRSGFFIRVRQELLHSRGYDVTVRKNALQSLFRSGDVVINTGLNHPVTLRDVPGADLVQAALHDLMENSRNSVAARRQQDQSASRDETTAWGQR